MPSFIYSITRCYPFYKGRGRFALSGFQRAGSDILVETQLQSGPRIYVYSDDYIGRMVLFFGDLDPFVTKFVLQNISRGDVVIDVGANLGVITLAAAAAVGSNGKIIAIEPNALLVSALEKSIELNGFLNVEIVNKALSDYSGTATLTIPDRSFGQAAISESGGKGEVCDVTLMDELPPQKHVRLLKIDVEGHEARVLKGGLNFIYSHNVDLILFESHHTRSPFLEREEVLILHRLEYRIFELRHGVYMSPKLISTTDDNYHPRSFDFVAVRSGAQWKS
ncbi:FkbM family methyltransferase [Thiocapsa roseopersicina]|nr:FkbM family methyltransferase [Thiocapsa roseopersicina]